VNKQKNQKYKLSSYWKIEQDDKSLVISGGADARYEIELESNEVSFFSSLRNDKTFYIDELDDYDRRVFEELVTAEIVVPELQKGKIGETYLIGADGEITRTKIMHEKNERVASLMREWGEWPPKDIQDLISPYIINNPNTYVLDGVPTHENESEWLVEIMMERNGDEK